MVQHADSKELRTFGLLVGSIFAIIGMWPMVFRNESPRIWAISLGGSLVGLGLALPTSLRHVHRIWMKIGNVLGWINTRILLGVIFYVLITPMGLVMRLFGKDSMRRVLVHEANTYRIVREPRPRLHMNNQF